MIPHRLLLAVPIFLAGGSTSLPAHEGHEHPHTDANRLNSSASVMTTRSDAKVLPPTKEDDVFHFVVYGDRTGGVPAGLKVLEQAVADTNLLDPDLVMTVGDLIQGYNEKPEWMRQMTEFHAIMNRLEMKWFPVAGNHDIYWRGDGAAPAGHHESNYEEHFGPLWYSFRHKNAGFVVLYSDEGDPVSNEKSFREGRLQTMSDAQLAFLDKALTELEDADHVFCFLHHPRWIGQGYTGGNWNVVHERLKQAGNVSAVFAGHIHQMRYDGPKDGIEYFTLATTGGHKPADIPGAGFLHHLNMVSVRKESISVSALPVGAVIDPREFTPEFAQEIELARSVRPILLSDDLILSVDGSTEGTISFRVSNPSPRNVALTATLDTDRADAMWRTTLDHAHTTLKPGEEKEMTFPVARLAGEVDAAALPAIRLELEYVGKSARIQLPDVLTPLGVRPGSVPAAYFADRTPDGCLEVTDEQAAIRVEAAEIEMPTDSPITLEAWVLPTDNNGFNAIIAKTQGSEYAFFSDEGVPQFDLNLDGDYVTVTGEDKLSTTRWTHLAGVYDGKQVRLFINGKLASQQAAKGNRRANALPLFIGADPDRAGNPTRPFNGKIDEVRLTKAALYTAEFEPARRLKPQSDTALLLHLDKRLGPFTLDHSPAAATGLMGPNSAIVPTGE